MSNTFQDIEFKFSNFAGMSSCAIRLSDLTLITGPNSSGKTYAVYAVYSFLKNLRDFIQIPSQPRHALALLRDGVVDLDLTEIAKIDHSKSVAVAFKNSLPHYFSVPDDFFDDATIDVKLPPVDVLSLQRTLRLQVRKDLAVELVKESGRMSCSLSILSEDANVSFTKPPYALTAMRRAIQRTVIDLLFGNLWVNTFAITSERTGISLFWKELDINKNQIIEKLISFKGKKIDPWEFVEDQTSRYALPITDNIDIARDADNVAKQKSFISEDPELKSYIRPIFDELAGGKYKYSKEGISFEYGAARKKKTLIPIYVASSSTKSLFLLDLFINHIAEKGDLLVFDEPELNLHPANQRLMAQLLVRLVSIGIKVIITSHSDFLIREINNRIMLSKSFPGAADLMNEYGISEKEVLDPSRVAGYLLGKDRRLQHVEVKAHGLDMRSIDEAIVGASNLQGLILSGLASSED